MRGRARTSWRSVGDIADLGLTLIEAKWLLAGVQQGIVSVQAGSLPLGAWAGAECGRDGASLGHGSLRALGMPVRGAHPGRSFSSLLRNQYVGRMIRAAIHASKIRTGFGMLPVQCKMARAALGLGVRQLAVAADVSPETIVRFEGGEVLRNRTVSAIRDALEATGVEFIPANGGGPGVRLRKGRAGLPPKKDAARCRAIRTAAKRWPAFPPAR
jgi:transcriptional regulator with XRE-family HTH domain